MMLVIIYNDIDVAIAAAAVADYRPKNVATKIKKKQIIFQLTRKNRRYSLFGRRKKNSFDWFALETENEIENAILKFRKKLRFDCFKFLQDEGQVLVNNK
jgi:phosphopantothenoylcysteine decarboxylase/phosphopantothenate--cysteine ligase